MGDKKNLPLKITLKREKEAEARNNALLLELGRWLANAAPDTAIAGMFATGKFEKPTQRNAMKIQTMLSDGVAMCKALSALMAPVDEREDWSPNDDNNKCPMYSEKACADSVFGATRRAENLAAFQRQWMCKNVSRARCTISSVELLDQPLHNVVSTLLNLAKEGEVAGRAKLPMHPALKKMARSWERAEELAEAAAAADPNVLAQDPEEKAIISAEEDTYKDIVERESPAFYDEMRSSVSTVEGGGGSGGRTPSPGQQGAQAVAKATGDPDALQRSVDEDKRIEQQASLDPQAAQRERNQRLADQRNADRKRRRAKREATSAAAAGAGSAGAAAKAQQPSNTAGEKDGGNGAKPAASKRAVFHVSVVLGVAAAVGALAYVQYQRSRGNGGGGGFFSSFFASTPESRRRNAERGRQLRLSDPKYRYS